MTGFINHTNCVHCDNLEVIEQALTRVLELEGASRIPLPPLSQPGIEKLSQEPWGCLYELRGTRNLWVVGLFVGASGWTIVKTSPAELLCYRAKGATRPRLSELAMHVGTEAFYLGVHETMREDQLEAILLEVNATGRTSISGIVDPEHSESGKFAHEQINQPTDFIEFGRFLLIDVPSEIYRVEKELQKEETRNYQQWKEQFLEDYSEQNLPLMSPIDLEQWKARFKENPNQLFAAEGGKQLFDTWAWALRDYTFFHSCNTPQVFDEAVGRILGGSHSYWNLNNLVYQVYTQQQQLEADGARLLYFQPPADYNPTSPYISMPLDSSSDNQRNYWFSDDEREDQGDSWSFWVDEDD